MIREEGVGDILRQEDKGLVRKVVRRAPASDGYTEEDKAKLAPLIPPESQVYDVVDPFEGMSPEEQEEWLRLGRNLGKACRQRCS